MTCGVTYDELVAFASNDLPAPRIAEIQGHLAKCDTCQRRLAAIGRADQALAGVPRIEPSAPAVLRAAHALDAVTRPPMAPAPPARNPEPEIMTLDEVAAFLRVRPDDLDPILDSLPAFELAGQVRVRRQKLLEWLDQRERLFRNAGLTSRSPRHDVLDVR